MRLVENGTPEEVLAKYAREAPSPPPPFSVGSMAALFCLTALSPVMVSVSLAIWLKERKAIFYKGLRFGRNKSVYYMYKFRTLPIGYQKKTGGILTDPDYIEIGMLFRFLRDSRLDELPQLFNVLRGDMGFVGPRPVRPEQYEELCEGIRQYDIRFRVKPGLIGFSQVFTPHDAPRRLRSRINNKFILKKPGFFRSTCLTAYTLYRLVSISLEKFSSYMGHMKRKRVDMKKWKENRTRERSRPKNGVILMECGDNGHKDAVCFQGEILDISKTHLRMVSFQIAPRGYFDFNLEMQTRKTRKNKSIRCKGKVVRQYLDLDDMYVFVLEFEPKNPFHSYLLDQYVFCKSIAGVCMLF